MVEISLSGSEGAPGGQLPGATREPYSELRANSPAWNRVFASATLATGCGSVTESNPNSNATGGNGAVGGATSTGGVAHTSANSATGGSDSSFSSTGGGAPMGGSSVIAGSTRYLWRRPARTAILAASAMRWLRSPAA